MAIGPCSWRRIPDVEVMWRAGIGCTPNWSSAAFLDRIIWRVAEGAPQRREWGTRSSADRLLGQSLGERDHDVVPFGLADLLPELGLDRELVGAVSQRHEGTLSGLAVNGPADFHQSLGSELLG